MFFYCIDGLCRWEDHLKELHIAYSFVKACFGSANTLFPLLLLTSFTCSWCLVVLFGRYIAILVGCVPAYLVRDDVSCFSLGNSLLGEVGYTGVS
jgi:hypothetical protein